MRMGPNIIKALEHLKPKFLEISSGSEPIALDAAQFHNMALRHGERAQDIRSATFTGKADKEMVTDLYQDYAKKIVQKLQDANIYAAEHEDNLAQQSMGRPAVVAPRVDVPLQLDAEQLLLLPDRSQSPSRMMTKAGIVQAGRVHEIIGGAMLTLSFDESSQLALPFQLLADRSAMQALLHDAHVLQDYGKRLRKLDEELVELEKGPQPPHNLKKTWMQFLNSLKKFGEKLKLERLKEVLGKETVRGRELSRANGGEHLQSLRDYCESICKGQDGEANMLEAAFTEALEATKQAGLRRYRSAPRSGDGQQLMVRLPDSRWAEAAVLDYVPLSGEHRLQLQGQDLTMLLHPWNHAPLQLPVSTFEETLRIYTNTLRDQHAELNDWVRGEKYKVLEHFISVSVGVDTSVRAGPKSTDVRDAHTLTKYLQERHQKCCMGEFESPFALLVADAACGKTSFLSQVIMYLLEDPERKLVPVFIRVQQLGTLLGFEPVRRHPIQTHI